MLEKIAEIIKDQLNTGDVEITAETRFKEDLEADSLDLFELVMALEEEYEVEIDSSDLEQITTVGAVMDYLKAKGVEA
ncbi:MAG: acyl carrier protein [Lachnospiraceae bacterium]|nr:acyl carrier protein [Lachnospiraceae bacterium]